MQSNVQKKPLYLKLKVENLDLETTLVVILSKSFTTAETMLNAKTVRNVILARLKAQFPSLLDEEIVKSHFCAVSTNLPGTQNFGISDDRVFKFWDWVGGRFSVSSAIGVLSLSIIFGFETVQEFLSGMRNIDQQFFTEKDIRKNVPVMVGLIGFFNTTIENYSSKAILPYCQGLRDFSAHIQQVSMESNGKQVKIDGSLITEYQSGYVNFGESGTKGQHSFFQALHQGKNHQYLTNNRRCSPM